MDTLERGRWAGLHIPCKIGGVVAGGGWCLADEAKTVKCLLWFMETGEHALGYQHASKGLEWQIPHSLRNMARALVGHGWCLAEPENEIRQ